MKVNRLLANWRVFIPVYTVIAMILLALIYVFVYELMKVDISSMIAGEGPSKEISIFAPLQYKGLWVCVIITLAVCFVRFSYLVRVSYGNINIGQKGTARAVTRQELEEQYPAVPATVKSFPGYGGLPVSWKNDREIYIDQTTVNSLVIGGTRSGKGQTILEPMAEIVSRAEEKASMIITDPKLELASKMTPKLREYGYETHILNLIDPEYSMGYNPLTLIVAEYKSGNYDTAQMLTRTLGFTVVAPKEGEKDPYFTDQARNVFIACIMADIEDNIALDIEANLIGKAEHEKKEKARKKEYLKEVYGENYYHHILKEYLADEEETEDEEKIREIRSWLIDRIDEDINRFRHEEYNSDDYYAMYYDEEETEYLQNTVSYEEYGEESASNSKEIKKAIAEAKENGTLPQLSINERGDKHSDGGSSEFIDTDSITAEYTAALLAVRDEQLVRNKKEAFVPEPFKETHENEKKINLHSIVSMTSELGGISTGRNRTALDDYFDRREEGNFAKNVYSAVISASEQTKGTILSVFKDRVSLFMYENIARMTAESTCDFIKVGFGDKPVAIFIALPDYDKSNWFMATVFINQLYFILAKLATAWGGKLYRRVHFILDEFGNLPPIEGMDSIITVCLGRNILFTLAIQAVAQLKSKYPEVFDTIKGNCGNWVYIMTEDKETAKEISELIGEETISVVNRTGKKLSINKEQTEMQEARALLNMNELMSLRMGENVVIRPMYRQSQGTKKEELIKATPIFNMGEHRMRFAYKYLKDIFPQNQMLYLSDNIEKIFNANEHLRGREFKLAGIEIETTETVDVKRLRRSARAYFDRLDALDKIYPLDSFAQEYPELTHSFLEKALDLWEEDAEELFTAYERIRSLLESMGISAAGKEEIERILWKRKKDAKENGEQLPQAEEIEMLLEQMVYAGMIAALARAVGGKDENADRALGYMLGYVFKERKEKRSRKGKAVRNMNMSDEELQRLLDGM